MKELNIECPEIVRDCLTNQDSFSKIANVISELVYSDNKIEHPLISILMPTYNAAFVTDAMKSAVNQVEAPDYNIVIVDNHSDKEVLNKVIEEAKRLDSGRISIFRNSENVGMHGNWNRCIQLCKAEYFTFLHSDDLLTETCLRDLWNCHMGIEPDAAIITLERVTEMDGTFISEEKQSKKKLGGLLTPKTINKRKKIQLLFPHGNGCGHFFSKKVMEEIGGYSTSGDHGGILRYNLSHPIYDLYKVTRIKRIGKNESVRVAAGFIPFSHYLRKQVIEQKFNNNRFLHYISRLETESASFSIYGVKPMRKLSFIERVILGSFMKFVYVRSRFSII